LTDHPSNLPPCQILIDKEGRMFHQGREMTHQGINRLLLSGLRRDEDGRYVIELDGQRCWVEVEDAPIVVLKVNERPGGGLLLSLSDQTQEDLDPASLWVGEHNVMYTAVREGRLPARFSRPAYYQLADRIVETQGGFALDLEGSLHPLDLERAAEE